MFHGILAMALLAAATGADTASVTGDQLRRDLAIESGRLRTTAIHNARSGGDIPVAGPEFTLTWGDGASVSSDEFEAESLRATDGGVQATLVHHALGLRAAIDYTAAPDRTWLYKQIQFTNTGNAPFLLRTVELEHFNLTGETVTYAVNPAFPVLGDWGQPVFTESLWLGVEFPATRTSATPDGTIFLRHHPGIEIQPGESYTTKRAVLGAAEPGAVQRAFMDYVATLTPIPDPPRANIYWNGFRVIKPPDRTPQGLAMAGYARKLRDLTGFTFAGWSYDAGFDMYRPDALFAPNEADIWDKTREALRPIDTPLGFWTSFSPIFDTPTHAWGKTQGFELQHDASYCLAGPKYYAAIRERLEEIVRTYGMNTINFDGMYWGQGFGCNQPGHGHLVGEGPEAGVYALERVVENKLAIFESLRRINPAIVLDLFVCGEWASPWWLSQLDGVHTVAGDTLGCDIPSPWLRDELITVRDIQVFDEHRRGNRQFPLWAEDLYGTQVRSDHLIDGVVVDGESMAARWEDEYTLALAGRGAVANHIVCCDLRVLDGSDGGLRFLGDAGNWVRRNAAIYRQFQLLGGEPARREVYGYSHGDGKGQSLVALRNPWIEPQPFALIIDGHLDLGAEAGPFFVNVAYPYRQCIGPVAFGDSVSIPLRDYDVVLIEVRAADRQFKNVPENARWRLADDGAASVLDPAPLQHLPEGQLAQGITDSGVELAGSVSVPEESDGAQLLVMLLPGEGAVQPIRAYLNDIDTPFALHRRTRGTIQDAWALIDVPAGRHTVRVALEGPGRGQVGAWLRANYTLKPTAGFTGDKPEGDFFPVFDADTDRRVTTLLPVRYYGPPMPPLPEANEVGISDLRDRCLVSKVGFFDVGWDRSCWPDDRVMRIGQTTYARGLGVHAPAEMVFDIAGAYSRFTADVGLHGIPPEKKNKTAPPGTCVFIVEGDGKTLYESPMLQEGDAPLPVDVDIAGIQQITLRTTNGGDSNYDDLAAWGDARLYR